MPGEARPLLLHSLSVFAELIRPALGLVRPKRIVEIGAEDGDLTKMLADFACESGATLISIDPEPGEKVHELASSTARVELIEAASPQALETLAPADVYILDGDHNAFTVARELQVIDTTARANRRVPLVIMHDVGWPWARRDMYYDPEAIPNDKRQPHTWSGGIRPDDPDTSDTGFSGLGAFAWALREGGEHNGVLTAVEDFLDQHPTYCFRRIPCVFGLGWLYPDDAPYAAELTELISPYDEHPLISRLEDNRLDLYLKVLDLQAELERTRVRYDRMVAALHAEIARLSTSPQGMQENSAVPGTATKPAKSP